MARIKQSKLDAIGYGTKKPKKQEETPAAAAAVSSGPRIKQSKLDSIPYFAETHEKDPETGLYRRTGRVAVSYDAPATPAKTPSSVPVPRVGGTGAMADRHATNLIPKSPLSASDPAGVYAKGYLAQGAQEMRQRQEELEKQLAQLENSGDIGGAGILRQEYDRNKHALDAMGKRYEDNFTGQFGASYTAGQLGQDAGHAWNDYLSAPSEERRRRAEIISLAADMFMGNNEEVLDEDAAAPWISQSLAGYLPQLGDQIKAGGTGALVGAALGMAVPGMAAKGAKAGYVAGSAAESYGMMRGSAFQDLIRMGVDEDTARAAANDEAVIASLIEMGDSILDVTGLGLGAGSLISAAQKGFIKKIAKKGAEEAAEGAAKKLLSALGKYGLNIGQEMLEEGSQQAVSIANRNRVLGEDASNIWPGMLSPGAQARTGGEIRMSGGAAELAGKSLRTAWDAFSGRDPEAQAEILEAAAEGGKIAAMMGAGGMALNKGVELAAGRGNRDTAIRPAEEQGAERSPYDILYDLALEMEQEALSRRTGTLQAAQTQKQAGEASGILGGAVSSVPSRGVQGVTEETLRHIQREIYDEPTLIQEERHKIGEDISPRIMDVRTEMGAEPTLIEEEARRGIRRPGVRAEDLVQEPTLISEEYQKLRQMAQEMAEEQVRQMSTREDAGRLAQAETAERQVSEQIPHTPLDELLSGGKRVQISSLSEAQTAEWDSSGREDLWIDSADRVYQMRPEEHISQRTRESVGDRKVHAFQFDHPEMQPHYRKAAEALIADAANSMDAGKTLKITQGIKGKERNLEILTSRPLQNAMDMGLSRPEIIKAAEDLIADKGQENYAAAKRLELVLDGMLSNGYRDTLGNIHEPDADYIRRKQGTYGYQDTSDPLPIWDMDEPTGRAVQSAYEAGLGGVPVSDIPKGADLAELDAYEAGRKESLRRAEKEAAAKKAEPVVEKTEVGDYTEVNETKAQSERIKVYRGSNRSSDPLEKNLASKRTIYDVIGKQDENGDIKLLPLEYYTESKDDAQMYANHDVDLFNELVSSARLDYNRLVMEGKTPENISKEQWIENKAKESYKILTGREDAQSGSVAEHTISPNKVLDLSGIGEHATISDIYAELNRQTGIPETQLDDLLVLSDISESAGDGDPVPVFRMLRNGKGSDVGSRVVQFMRDQEYDAVKYAESGTNHYAVLSDNDLQQATEKPQEAPAKQDEETPAPVSEPSESAARNPQRAIADALTKYISKGQDFTAARLFELADKYYGGTMAEGKYTVKDAYDAMELAVNRYLISADFIKDANGNAAKARETLSKLEDLLKHLPTQTKRTEEQEQFQQFSTPPNIAYLAAWCANVSDSDVVLEPSAGIGGLALWPKAWGAKVYGNELSKRRLAFLDELGLDGIFNLNAEQIDNLLPENIKPSVVIMNPPFSATAGRTSRNDTANAKRHIQQALDRLEDGGRLVAIVGKGMANDAPAFKSWWNELRQEYSIRANVRMDGKNYRKYGTTFDEQLVVIDKTGTQMGATLTGEFSDLSKIPEFMEAIRNDRTRIPVQHLEHTGQLSERVSEPEIDPGAHPVRGERPEHRSREAGNAGGSEARADQRSGQRGTRGGLLQPAGAEAAVRSGDGERGDGRGTDGDGRGTDGDGADKLSLDRAAVTDNTAAKEAVENPDSVYATYSPKKVHITGAKRHPAKLVESAAMAAVEPPAATYTPALPQKLVADGILSDAQLENVVYAGQAHGQMLESGQRKGYFIGDGTGVGKGRQLSGIIMDNFMQGRDRAIWISNSANLYEDAIRDWTDLGGKKEDVLNFAKIKLGQDIKAKHGILFSTYDTIKMEKDQKSRLKDLERWLGKDFDGVICFDEAHNMANATGKQGKRGNTKPSAKALAGIKLQQMFPKARVVYASATGATDIGDYAYLERLGLWGPGTAFHNAQDFTSKISTGGLAAMELVARDMKSMGVYMARSISYDDVSYDTLQHDLTPMQTEIYNTMSRAWQTVLQNMQQALEVTGANKNGRARGAVNSVFYGTQQRFYNQVITSMSMPSVIEDMRRELDNGRSCVLQIVNTNEAQAKRAISAAEKEGLSLDDLDMTPSDTLIEMVKKSFPVQEYEKYTDENGNELSRPVTDGNGNPVLSKKAIRMRDQLVEDLQQMKVPDGPMEMLFDAFGVDNVAEVTGRGRRVVEKADENGQMHRVIEKRSSKAGIADAQMFQDGKKRILIFSDAGGTGKSYHADNRAKNQQKRVHYLIQPGWNASKATQGFGRTHRSNQANAPIFRLVTTNVMGQKRFTSTIARRLDQLGALTKGQRQAGSGIFGEKDNLEGPIAQDALYQYYKTLDQDVLRKLGLYDAIYDKSGKFKDGSDALWDIGRFLNRILALEVDEQNEVFQGFYDTFDRMMDVAIANGTVDMGLENYRADKIEVVDEKTVRQDKSGADTKYVQMKTYHKPELIPLANVKKMHQNFQGLVRTEDGDVRAVFEISAKTDQKTGAIQRRFKLESPIRGKSSVFVESTLKKQTKPIDKSEWAAAWKAETAKAPEYNEGTLHLLTGTLLPIWDRLPANNTRVMRVISSDGQQFLGRVIRADQIDGVLKSLGTNRTMQTYTPAQVSKSVMEQGKEIVFRDNKLRMIRRKVSGQWRMELTGQNIWFINRQVPGVITERINFENRYFMPVGNEAALTRLMELNPVVEIRDTAPSGDVDRMIIGSGKPDRSENWTAQRVGEKKESPMRLAELVEKIRHDFEINITTGHIRGSGVAGQYSHIDHGIRIKVANALPDIAHELGHHLDLLYEFTGAGLSKAQRKELIDNLDPEMAKHYEDNEKPGEGFAEFVRRFLQNRETAAIDYPQFTPAFLNGLPEKIRALVENLADEVNAYYSQDVDTATSSIRLREEKAPDARTVAEKLMAKAKVLAQAWLDSNRGIREFDRATGANTYKLASNAAYSDAMAGQIIVGDLTDANGQYVAPGLKAALQGLDLNNIEEYRLFGEYLAVKHGPERLAEGMQIFSDDRKDSTAFMRRRQAALENEYPQFAEISDRLYAFQQELLQTWGVSTGLVSPLIAKKWAKRWKFYVPMNRVVSEDQQGIGAKRSFANQTSTIKIAHGSGLEIVHPVDNIIDNIVKMVNAGVRNNVMRAITDQAHQLGADAAFLEQVPSPLVRHSFDMTGVKKKLSKQMLESGIDADAVDEVNEIIEGLDDVLYQYGRGKAHGDVITVLKNGDQEFWKINDPLLLSSLTSMNQRSMEGILDAYAVVSRFMTSNITGNNVVWSIFSNFPRDLMTMFTYSKIKDPVKLLSGIGSAYVNKAKGDHASPLFREFLAMGGGKVSAYTADRDLAKRARKSLAGRKISANPLDWITYVSDMIEAGPRYATYKMLREAGMDPQEAFYEAMDITTNFRRGGHVAREINKVVPFFNASVQGLDKFRRWIIAEELAGKPGRRKVVGIRTISYIAASAALAGIFYGINTGDDEAEEDYAQLSTFTKNSFWNVPLGDGKYFSIPKPREIGVLSSFIETCMEYGISKNDHAFDEFYQYATDNFLPSLFSDVAQVGQNGLLETGMGMIGSLGMIGVVGYLGANRDFLGRPIVSAGLQNLEPKDQYTARTSSIAHWIGQAFNASPAQIDYFFQQVLGGWWKYWRALFPVGKENVDLTLGVQNTYIKDNQYSTDLVNWLYDKADASAKARNSDRKNIDKAITAKMDGDMTTFYGRYYSLAKDKPQTTTHRAARQLVLDMIREYQKADDHGALTPAQTAVYAVCRDQGSTEYLPGVMQDTVKDGEGVKHQLSDIQYVELQTEYLRLYWEFVEYDLGGTEYGEKAAALKAAKKVAAETAINNTLTRIGQPKTEFSAKFAGVDAKDVVTFEARKDLANDDDSLTQDELVDILKIMVDEGLEPEDAYVLFRSRYESDRNNPWRWFKPT